MKQQPGSPHPGCACGAPTRCASPPPRAGAGSARTAAPRRRAGRACDLYGNLVLDGKRVPTGPCWVRQTACKAVLSWTERDGEPRAREISHALLRQLLDEGLLQQRA
jgi:hypothetical protein